MTEQPPPVQLRISELTVADKRNYLLVLISMASSDQHLAPEELAVIQKRAKQFDCELKKSDLKMYDLGVLARSIQKPSLQEALFRDMVKLAAADRKWAPEELDMIKYFSLEWVIPLPQLQGVDWERVGAPTPRHVEETSIRKRGQLYKRRDLLKAADPGIRWGWVFAGAGIYFGLSMAFGFMLAAMRTGDDPSFGEADPLGAFGGLFACFLAGLIVALLSPGRTIREPAIGVLIPLLLITLLLMVVAIGSGSGGAILPLLMGLGCAGAIQYGCALLGAYIGEAISGNK